MVTSFGIDSAQIQRIDVPYKNLAATAATNTSTPNTNSPNTNANNNPTDTSNPNNNSTTNEIKGIAFVEFGNKDEMKKALDQWTTNSGKSEYGKLGIKVKKYTQKGEVQQVYIRQYGNYRVIKFDILQ